MEFSGERTGTRPRWLLWTVGLLILPLLALPWIFLAPATITYRITNGRLLVDARLGPIHHSQDVALADVKGVDLVTPTSAVRLAGTGRPPDLCAGRFRTPETGSAWAAFPCAVDDLVAVRLADDTLLLGPADREGFVAALRAGADADLPVAPVASGPAMVWWPVGLLVVILVPAAWAMRRFTQPFVYRVADGILDVPATFGRVRVPLAGARVHAGTLGRWTIRVAGTAVPGRALGLFRGGGRWMHIAATGNDGLLVEGRRNLFVTPEDVDAFLAAVRAQGAVVG